MPTKANRFRTIERELLAPEMQRLGFERPKGMSVGGWARTEGSEWLVAWTQLNKLNYGDDPEGYSFTFELQLDDSPVAAGWGTRERLHHLLGDEQRLAFVQIHNAVMRKVAPNPAMRSMDDPDDLADLAPRATPFSRLDDPWMRYTDEADVRTWLSFVAMVAEAAIGRLLDLAAAEKGGELVWMDYKDLPNFRGYYLEDGWVFGVYASENPVRRRDRRRVDGGASGVRTS